MKPLNQVPIGLLIDVGARPVLILGHRVVGPRQEAKSIWCEVPGPRVEANKTGKTSMTLDCVRWEGARI